MPNALNIKATSSISPDHEPALVRAIRESEIMRVRVIIALSVIFFGVAMLRLVLTGQWQELIPPLSICAITIIYESLVLRAAIRAHRENRGLALSFWRFNAAIESLVPTAALFLLSTSGEVEPYQGLLGPPVLGYPAFLMVQILSLRPSIILIGALTSTIGYTALVFVVSRLYEFPPGMPLPPEILIFFPVGLFVLGLGGAGVCARIRSHVEAEITHAAHRKRAESELDAAGRIQQSLLPIDAPRLSGYEIAAWNRPAVHTGGDYYDWQVLPDGKVAVMLADVSGHGLGPALVAAFCRAYTRASLGHHDSLAAAIARVNALVRDDLPESWFITFVAAVLEPDADVVELLSAGHGPILHYVAATGEIDTSGADGIPLGINKDLNIAKGREFQLAKDDLLILITDGFHEWDGPGGERYGVQRLCESIQRHAGEAPRDIIESALKDLEQFAGRSPQEDDLTILVVKRM